MREQTIKLADEVSTRVLDTGARGVPIILVHGLANSLEIWSRILPVLAAHRRVILFDLPGFGLAERPAGAYDTTFFVRHLAGLLDSLELEHADLVGNSLGGSVALHFAAANKQRVRRLVVAAPGGFGPGTHPIMRVAALPLIGGWLARPTPANNRRTLRLALHDRTNLTAELQALTDLHAAVPGSRRSFVRTLQAGVGLFGARNCEETAQAARSLDQPVLVAWGRQDRVFPSENAERALTLLPAGKLCLIDRCGHYPHWEQPEIFAHASLEFLS